MNEIISALEKGIYHQKTKEYFQEVISSYENGNYRSAIVMLYTVVICDLVFKLNDLKDVHKDEKAQKILEELEMEKNRNPVSPNWENTLIEKAFTEAKLLENDVYTHIDTLKRYRNLSGHPVLNSLEILYSPNKELVESLIINVLTGLLTKHPLLTKNVFVPFLQEIERIKNDFPIGSRLETYLESKFLVYFNKELVQYIFKHLWKISFKSNEEKATENREINIRVLSIIYKKYEGILYEFINNESTYFSEFADENINLFVDFLAYHPRVFKVLQSHTQELLTNRVNASHKLMIRGFFLSNTLKEHFQTIDSRIHRNGNSSNQPYIQKYVLDEEDIYFLLSIIEEEKDFEDLNDLMISHYYHSFSYDAADKLFDYCIKPFYSSFNRVQMEKLLSEINCNPQCYNGRSSIKNQVLLETARNLLGYDIEEKYPNVFYKNSTP